MGIRPTGPGGWGRGQGRGGKLLSYFTRNYEVH